MGYICAPVLLGLGSPLTQEKRDPSLHKKTLSRKVRTLSVSDGETETPRRRTELGIPSPRPLTPELPHLAPYLSSLSGADSGVRPRLGASSAAGHGRGAQAPAGLGCREAAPASSCRGPVPGRGASAGPDRAQAPPPRARPPPVLPPRRPRSHARRRPSFLSEHGARPAGPPARLASPR